jgi:site-specific recombinase XerD
MLANTPKMHRNAVMSTRKKRTRVTPSKTSANGITVRPYEEFKNGKRYAYWLVQGWQEEGKWQRKRFPVKLKVAGKERDFDTANAEAEKRAKQFAADTARNIANDGTDLRTVSTTLNDEQHNQAVEAFAKLGGTYSLEQAVDFFLKNHRAPDFTIKLSEAIEVYLNDCKQWIRANTLRQKESVLGQLRDYLEDPFVHEVTRQRAEGFLRGLRAKDKVSPAKRKTWNNYRNDLNHFFAWAMEEDKTTHRPFTFNHPIEGIPIYSAKQVAEQRSGIVVTAPNDVQHLLSVLMRWRGGCMVKFFALAYFAGIRPGGELIKLGENPGKLINMRTGIITIPAAYSKTKEERQIEICANLRKWLVAYDKLPIVPEGFEHLYKTVRKHFGMNANERDETRHSFISFHVGLHRSIGETALQAGNSESIVKKHYFKNQTKEDSEFFFSIIPDMEAKRAVRQTPTNGGSNQQLKAVS